MSLLLPWEVIERVIEHASDDHDLLRSFSLTCRQLRPRSFALIVAQYIFLDSRDRVSDFSDYLLSNPELQPLIHSISISPADFRPFPLVNMLPHLSALRFISPRHRGNALFKKQLAVELHPNTLNCYRFFGKRIRTLSFDNLSLRVPCDFFRLLLSFPNTTQITCRDIFIKIPAKGTSAVETVRWRLSNQLQLETIKVSIDP